MRGFLLFILFVPSLFSASEGTHLYELYQNGQYEKACSEGLTKLRRHQNDENFVSLYAFACLQADRIDRLAVPVIMLNQTKEARKNAAFFAAILLQKKLLFNALESRESLEGLTLPTSDFLLSKVFDLYSAHRYTEKDGIYTLQDPENPRQTYRLYLRDSGKTPRLCIDEYYDTILTKQHLYR